MYSDPFTSLFRPAHIITLALAGLWLAGCGDSTPSDPPAAPQFTMTGSTTQVEVRKVARLQGDGAVRVHLRARCPAGYHVVEGPVTVAQTPESQATFAEAFFTTTCDGTWRRFSLRAEPIEGRFTTGRARVSASLMTENAAGDFQQGSDSEIVRVIR
ncbi:MAG TPA: hypothetical protein VD930_04700 [Gemmatimonadales bacterium]|nr:hypothetical protein [Gemmatimonadales bacterium]